MLLPYHSNLLLSPSESSSLSSYIVAVKCSENLGFEFLFLVVCPWKGRQSRDTITISFPVIFFNLLKIGNYFMLL